MPTGLARRTGIELIRTGTWGASTGAWSPTPADLAAAVEAQQCAAVRRPRLKLGHTDERFNNGGDGEPALGWFEDLRLSDDGHALIGDQVALPWLSQVQAAAYPDRSIEGAYRYRCGLGHEHPFALTAVALLGVTPPAVATLKSVQDLPGLLGVAATAGTPDCGERVHAVVYASAPTPLPAAEPDPNTTLEDKMSLSDEMRSRLGLDADADETAALAAIDALKAKADQPIPEPAPTPEMVAASAAATEKAEKAEAEKDELRKEVTVLASQVETMSARIAAQDADTAKTVKASVLDTAQREGKFKPHEREQWETDYDEAPGVTTRTLGRIAVGYAVPVMASGVTGAPEPSGADTAFEADYERVFGAQKAGA
ncbi:phage protease [Actinoplanes rectilineatus]|uniref:phage protease n=1 Tax=Actinoplanes rectilineatus TaxID=113571 RepID=UPI000698537D|nr:phage protease [Actinoplanes rectilineatus]